MAYASSSVRFSGLTPEQYAPFVSVCAAVGLDMKRKILIARTFTEMSENPSKSAMPRRIQVWPRVSHFVAAWSRQKKSGNLMIPIEPTKKKSCLPEVARRR
ncbi:MAG: hypothetical protein Q7V06_00590 [Methanocalculus sp.]|nr:hypothetical protein [Methanocalculus sp.]